MIGLTAKRSSGSDEQRRGEDGDEDEERRKEAHLSLSLSLSLFSLLSVCGSSSASLLLSSSGRVEAKVSV